MIRQRTIHTARLDQGSFPGPDLLHRAASILVTLVLIAWFPCRLYSQPSEVPWYVSQLSPPTSLPVDLKRPVVIAVVDDGFRLSHTFLRDYLYRNSLEIPGNRIDDDGNGYVDDHSGWDVSDGDPDVSIPAGREPAFYHGTFVSGAITRLLERSFGDKASACFRILPVKALSDRAGDTYLKDGYKGIAYAIAQKADIIVCAWNGGYLTAEEEQMLASARAQGIVIVASAGNFYQEKAAPPAAHPAVIAVAALDSSLQKMPRSNYGQFVDLAGPGQDVLGANSLDDNSVFLGGESSAAVAAVAAAFAQLKALAPESDPETLLYALQNTAAPVDHYNLPQAGKLGAGFPQLQKAAAYLSGEPAAFNPFLPEGRISSVNLPEKTSIHEWRIEPAGAYKGIWLTPVIREPWSKNAKISFYDEQDRKVRELPGASSPSTIFIPGNRARVVFEQPKKRRIPHFHIPYHVETIDSAALFCRNVQYYELAKARITDGSGEADYANACDCKWQITAPPGHRIRLRFLAFDTQAKVDFVYLFDGESTIQQNILAKFSGPALPPQIVSRTNKVLIWFVTDATQTAGGWTLEYEAINVED